VKALVTGASGFIGSHLVESLLQKNIQVRCLLRSTSSRAWLKGLTIEEVEGDLFDRAALARGVEGVDYIYHSAGVTKAKTAEEYFRGNAEGTATLLDAARQHAPGLRRFVLLSSQTAAGPSPSATPITEDAPCRPITNYGRSKRRAEEIVLAAAAGMPVTVTRPPVVFGPRDKDVYEFFRTMSRGLQPSVGFGEKAVSMIHVADLVRGIIMAAESERGAGQVYFISSPTVYTWRDIGDITKRILEKWVLRVRVPESGVYVIAAVAEAMSFFSSKAALINFEKARDMVQDYWTCDAGKAKRDFGFEAQMSLEAGIADTVAWYKKNGWL
jgi:nucleoside-diphosphate-sugar epimerase